MHPTELWRAPRYTTEEAALSIEPKETRGIAPRGLRHLFKRHGFELGNRCRHLRDIGGFVPPAAVWDRSQIRAIGFNKQPVHRHERHDRAQVPGRS